ncbi:hypothetical protein KAZ66_03665 [Candidatus Woesebacteria bacterium]|nr:hypothetical protein [Candidatus Woesebacteria bacterium]
MNLQRIARKTPFSISLIMFIFITILTFLYVWFIPPFNMLVIIPFIFLLTSAIYIGAGFFLKKKYQVLCAVFVASFLLLNGLIGFDLINTILLLSFIIAVSFLFK